MRPSLLHEMVVALLPGLSPCVSAAVAWLTLVVIAPVPDYCDRNRHGEETCREVHCFFVALPTSVYLITS